MKSDVPPASPSTPWLQSPGLAAVTTAVWAVTWMVSNGSAVAFHALGLILHAAATGLGVLLFAELMPLRVATTAGVLFAVHPVHVEATPGTAPVRSWPHT